MISRGEAGLQGGLAQAGVQGWPWGISPRGEGLLLALRGCDQFLKSAPEDQWILLIPLAGVSPGWGLHTQTVVW